MVKQLEVKQFILNSSFIHGSFVIFLDMYTCLRREEELEKIRIFSDISAPYILAFKYADANPKLVTLFRYFIDINCKILLFV